MGTLALVMWLGMQAHKQPMRPCTDGDWVTITTIPPTTEHSPDCEYSGITGGPGGIHECLSNPVSGGLQWKPLVVPAVHKRDWTFNEETYLWDCEDKTMILEHDQGNPPQYWCRAEVR